MGLSHEQKADREFRVPPRKHLRKMRERLNRLEELGLHEWLRPGTSERMPTKQARREYMEVHDKLIGENLPDLLDDLIGEDDENPMDE